MLLLRDPDTVQKEEASAVEDIWAYLHGTDWSADTDFKAIKSFLQRKLRERL